MKISNKHPSQLELKLKYEVQSGYPQVSLIGIDEVGVGCLAGPVVAGAVLLPSEFQFEDWQMEIDDSKKIPEKKRKTLSIAIRNWVPTFGIGLASPKEIDEINILNASHLAMKRAVLDLQSKILEFCSEEAFALIDGRFVPREFPLPARAIIQGDAHSFAIGCASILAKVHRDELMEQMDEQFPGYGFKSHKGYGTAQHRKALQKLGSVEIHRKSFAPVLAVQLFE